MKIGISPTRGKTKTSYRAFICSNYDKKWTKSFDTEKDAYNAGVELYLLIGNINASDKILVNSQFSIYLSYFIEKYCQPKKESWKKDEGYIRNYINPQLGKYKISEFSPSVLDSFFQWLRKQSKSIGVDVDKIRELKELGYSISKIAKTLSNDRKTVRKYLKKDLSCLSGGSINRIRSLLHTIFQHAITKHQLLIFNPVKSIEKEIEPDEVIKFWEEEQVEHFLHVNQDSPYRSIYQFGFNSGCRIGELLGLSFNQINNISKKVMIDRQYDCDEKLIKRPKNKKTRYIPLPKSVLTMVNNRRHQAITITMPFKEKDQTIQEVSTKLIFHNGDGSPISYNQLKVDFAACCKKAGLENQGMYCMRHTYGTLFIIKNGENWQKLQKYMGHADYKTTLKYVHLVESFFTEEEAVLEFGAPERGDKVIPIQSGQIF